MHVYIKPSHGYAHYFQQLAVFSKKSTRQDFSVAAQAQPEEMV
jgi:hypothetical protein